MRRAFLPAILFITIAASTAAAGEVQVMLYKGGDAKAVARKVEIPRDASKGGRVAAVLRALVGGPTPSELEAGYRTAFPAGTTVDAVAVDGSAVTVTLAMDDPPPATAAAQWDDLQAQVINTLGAAHPDLREFTFHVRSKGRVTPLNDLLRLPRPMPPPKDGGSRLIRPGTAPKGTLSGKRVAISPGHGWYWTGSGWTTQRGDTGGLIEDFLTADICLHWLVPYLEKAGAQVIVPRERDFNTNEVILDNGGAGYAETGAWSDGSSPGGYKNSYRVAATAPGGGAEASYTMTVPGPGSYRVSLWYVAGANRVVDAPLTVSHLGGESSFAVNQQIDGSTWTYLDPFFFFDRAVVTLSNRSAATGYAIADAVRLGGGTGSIDRGGGASGKPRWQESARYFTQFSGAPSSVYEGNGSSAADNSNDVVSRPLFANWSNADLFLSVHTNAFDGTATGTETFIYNGTATPGSDTLRHLVNTQLVGDIRAGWDASWVDRGEKTANFGEVREIVGMPAALTEIAFHDGVTGVPDNTYLHDTRFKRLAGRALYRAIAKFVDAQAPLITEPPEGVMIVNSAKDRLTVSWKPVTGADSYRVHLSTDGKAFDNGTAAPGASLAVDGLIAGGTYFARVTAVNAGGESFPSPVVAARVADRRGWVPLLLVHAYDRIDGRVSIDENPGTWLLPHAVAAAEAGYFFDGAAHEAITGAAVLAPYKAADWIVGRESTGDETFSTAEQAVLAAYLDAGGGLFVTGTEIAWDLGAKGSAADQAFLKDYLKASYATDDSGTYQVQPVAGGIYEGVAPFAFDNGTHGTYNAAFPDTLTAQGSLGALQFSGGAVAGVAYAGTFKSVYFGFPFETIFERAAAVDVMGRTLKFLVGEIPAEVDAGTPDAGPDDAGPDTGMDAGPVDAGADAGDVDAGADDAGPDAGSPDAGRECNEGAARCIAAEGVEACVNGAWIIAAACGAGTACEKGECVPAVVDAGTGPKGASDAGSGGDSGGCGCTTITI